MFILSQVCENIVLRLAESMLLHKIFLGHVRDEKGAFLVLAWLRKILCFRVWAVEHQQLIVNLSFKVMFSLARLEIVWRLVIDFFLVVLSYKKKNRDNNEHNDWIHFVSL